MKESDSSKTLKNPQQSQKTKGEKIINAVTESKTDEQIQAKTVKDEPHVEDVSNKANAGDVLANVQKEEKISLEAPKTDKIEIKLENTSNIEDNSVERKENINSTVENSNTEKKDEEINEIDGDSSDDDDDIEENLETPNLISAKSEIEDDIIVSEDFLATELIKLVSNPHPEDMLLFCIPVCAPYQSLNSYKYRTKLVPGTLKKGRAVKTVMSVFTTQKDIIDNERKLIKAMSDNELVQAMIGNVKIAAVGLLKIKMNEKKAKTQKKKDLRIKENPTQYKT